MVKVQLSNITQQVGAAELPLLHISRHRSEHRCCVEHPLISILMWSGLCGQTLINATLRSSCSTLSSDLQIRCFLTAHSHVDGLVYFIAALSCRAANLNTTPQISSGAEVFRGHFFCCFCWFLNWIMGHQFLIWPFRTRLHYKISAICQFSA